MVEKQITNISYWLLRYFIWKKLYLAKNSIANNILLLIIYEKKYMYNYSIIVL